jgi:hypothetical protein
MTRIDGSPEIVFDLIADLPNYGRWLPGSEAFGGTTQVSPYSARVRSNSESFSTFHPGSLPLRKWLLARTEYFRPRPFGNHR